MRAGSMIRVGRSLRSVTRLAEAGRDWIWNWPPITCVIQHPRQVPAICNRALPRTEDPLRASSPATPSASSPEIRCMDDPTQLLLLYFVMPVWFLAGLADYLCHRATDIAHTAGPKESVIHLLMFAEIAIPLLMCLF